MSKVINIELSESSINQAIKELEEYGAAIEQKTELLRKRLADRLGDEAASGFKSSIVDDIISSGGDVRNANVEVTVDHSGKNVSVVIANGKDAVWVEFGAGVYHNGSADSSPHPEGARLGYTIGSFGENGSKNVWGYYGGDGKLVLTHGTPATMPVYHAVQTVCREYVAIAKEIFA